MRIRLLFFYISVLMSSVAYASDNIAIYNNIIRANPSDWETRYKLAKLYFERGNYDAARYNFEFVRAYRNLPDDIAHTTDKYLSQIRYLKKWDTEFGIGAIPDSSINYTPSNHHECTNTIHGTICSEITDPTTGIGFQINGATNFYTNIYKNLGLRTTIGGAILNIANNIPTDYSGHFAIGPRYIFASGDIHIQPSFGIRIYDNKFYNFSYGLRLGGTIQLPAQLFTDIGLDIQRTHYQNNDINHVLHGHNWTFYIHPKYYINDTSFISLTTALSHNHTQLRALGFDTGRIGIGYFYKIPYGFNFYINAMYSYNEYHASGTFITNTAPHYTTRRDKIYQIYTRIYNSYINLYNFIPALSYTYTIQDSNIPTYDIQNHQFTIEIVKMF